MAAGERGVAAGVDASVLVIEMSTVGPAVIAEPASALPEGTALLDAPVLGSVAEAEAGELTVLAGGPAPLVERARPLLEQLGSVVHVGPLGSGAAAKLLANAALFGSVALLGEALALARGLALAEDTVYEVLALTPLAGQAARRREAIGAGDYPRRFALSLARKDAELISEVAAEAGTELRLVEATRSWMADAHLAGFAERDYTVVLAQILAATGGAAAGGDRPAPGGAAA